MLDGDKRICPDYGEVAEQACDYSHRLHGKGKYAK